MSLSSNLQFNYAIEIPIDKVIKARRWLIENKVDCEMKAGQFVYRNWQIRTSDRIGYAKFVFVTDDRLMMFALKFS